MREPIPPGRRPRRTCLKAVGCCALALILPTVLLVAWVTWSENAAEARVQPTLRAIRSCLRPGATVGEIKARLDALHVDTGGLISHPTTEYERNMDVSVDIYRPSIAVGFYTQQFFYLKFDARSRLVSYSEEWVYTGP